MTTHAAEKPLIPWQRGVHVYNQPMVTRTFLLFVTLAFVGIVLSIVRTFGGLGFTGMSDAYAWGIWKTFNVMTLTALGSGGFAIGIAAWLFDWKRLHVVMRTALITSLLFYLAGLLALVIDVGRPWNMWLVFLPWKWNTHSSLLEVAVCMPLYALVFLAFENIPPVYERIYVHASDGQRRVMQVIYPWIKRVYPLGVAGAYVLPMMHQSSLGALLLLGGEKLHPLWQSQALPLLYVIQAGVAGVACVTFTLMIACTIWERPLDMEVIGDLGKLMGGLSVAFLVIRFVDLVWRGALGHAFEPTFLALVFHAENLLVLVPAIFVFRRELRVRPRVMFLASIATMLGAMIYRFTPTTISFTPNQLAVYFPTTMEILISLGYISLTIVGFQIAVKALAILPAPISEWYQAVAWARQHYRTIRVDIHGKASRD
ncbi:Ni/Fe-hydrogenase cytochrome b subunit [Myxococcota bacterium]|nr:Ni/Fe-hydrogenase cytochrome b subunit [Myxococcota bacterium]